MDNLLKYRRRHSRVFDVRSFKGVGSDTDRYLVMAEVRDRLEASNQTTQKFDIE
jgi:hypothetical protein